MNWRLINMLSLDVAAGAVASALFFAKLLGVQLLPQGLLVLGITVWLIYTADHLADAWRVKQPASSLRHHFHQVHFRALAAVAVVLLLIDLVLVLFVRRPILEMGIVFSVVVALYIPFSHKMRGGKELVAGLLYCGGVMLPSFALSSKSLSSGQALVAISFLLVVWINLLLFAWMSLEQDQADRQTSLVTLLGPRTGRFILMGLFVLLMIVLSWPQASPVRMRLVLGLMGMVMLILFLLPGYFKQNDRFRYLGDAIFLLPLLVVW